MQTVALVSQKGGAGKTTLAIHLAAEAYLAGKKALVIDLDPQGSATHWGDLRGTLPPDVAPEHPARLQAALEAAEREGYDLVVIDTAPHQDQAALRAARSANVVLIPVRPATFDIAALDATIDVCRLAGRDWRVVINGAPHKGRVTAAAVVTAIKRGCAVLAPHIRQRVAFQHCLAVGQVVREFEPDSPATDEIAALYAEVT